MRRQTRGTAVAAAGVVVAGAAVLAWASRGADWRLRGGGTGNQDGCCWGNTHTGAMRN